MTTDAKTHSLAPREVAGLTGVSTDTLRHYERKGLLDLPPRTSNGYRRYPADAVERVQLIQRALTIGFTLNELADVLNERQRGGAPCHVVRTLVGERLEDLDRQLHDLKALRQDLQLMLESWDAKLLKTPTGQRADLLSTLVTRPGMIPRPPTGRIARCSASPGLKDKGTGFG